MFTVEILAMSLVLGLVFGFGLSLLMEVVLMIKKYHFYKKRNHDDRVYTASEGFGLYTMIACA
jgi:hypothetical protein